MYTMEGIVAKFANKLTEQNRLDLNRYARIVENGRTDGVSFYVSTDYVSAYRWHSQLSVDEQTNLLNWFLDGFKYELINL